METEPQIDLEDELPQRQIIMLPHGRRSITRLKPTKRLGFVHITHVNRGLEWIHIKAIFREFLLQIDLHTQAEDLDDIVFGWKHLPSITTLIYHPRHVFCDFSLSDLQDSAYKCVCLQKRFKPFGDPLTVSQPLHQHVRTTDLQLIHNSVLRNTLQCGMNHIPLQPTYFSQIYQELDSACDQTACLLKLNAVMTTTGSTWIKQRAQTFLHVGARANRNGHRVSGHPALPDNALDEIRYLSEHFFMTGLDKASNNISFIYPKLSLGLWVFHTLWHRISFTS